MEAQFRFFLVIYLVIFITIAYGKYRKPVIKYPKDTVFWATDFFVKGCRNFLDNCPSAYKTQEICARSYGGDYRDFANYCQMQYENCNTWRKVKEFGRKVNQLDHYRILANVAGYMDHVRFYIIEPLSPTKLDNLLTQ